MEAISRYLDSMFANLPNTAAVLRAKDELRQMMEDKYNELISEGKTENEAVGTVISEFGNLEELAEALGLEEEMRAQREEESETPCRVITMEEAQLFLKMRSENSMKRGIGIALCILSVVFPILLGGLLPDKLEILGVAGMFLCIAAGVVMIVFSGVGMKQWDFMKREKCLLSMDAMRYVQDEKISYYKFHIVQLSIGIVLCSLCWLPCVLAGELIYGDVAGIVGASLLFALIAGGVLMIVYTTQINRGFLYLLSMNGSNTVAGNYRAIRKGDVKYQNQTQEIIMSVYWPVIACIYLAVSFATFGWWITWIIWPVAAIVHTILDNIFRVKEQ